MVVYTCITRAAPCRTDLPGVGKQEPTQCAVTRCTWEWQVELRVGNEPAGTTKVVIGIDVPWAQRRTFIAAYRTDTTGVDVLDDREGFAAVSLAPVSHEVERQGVRTPQRDVMLVLAMQHVIAQIHGGEICCQTRVITLGGCQRAVTCVFGPANVEDDGVRAFTIFVDEIAVSTGRVDAQTAQPVVFKADAGKDA